MKRLLLGYNTNGFAHHRLEDAIRILGELGYGSVAITLDYHALNPAEPGFAVQLAEVKTLLRKLKLRCVIETGARFLLDPRRKHQPTLLASHKAGQGRRLIFLQKAIDIAAKLEADAVSFWSGTPTDSASERTRWNRLVQGCRSLSDYAMSCGVRLAFEPEPGMFIDTMERFARLHDLVDHPHFGLTLDVGHVYCLGEEPASQHIRRWRKCLWNVHIEDMRRGVHDHLRFGEGEIDFSEVFRALKAIRYSGGVHVELSRHSHNAVVTAREALTFLKKLT